MSEYHSNRQSNLTIFPSIKHSSGQCATNGKDMNKIRTLPPDYVLSKNDVICGRGSRCFNHEGNKRFRNIIQINLTRYAMADSKLRKSEIISHVMDQIRSTSPFGGFVKEDLNTGRYVAVSDFHAREKISQALRDALFTSRKSSSFCKLFKTDQERLSLSSSMPFMVSQRVPHQSTFKNHPFSEVFPCEYRSEFYLSNMRNNNFHDSKNDISSQDQISFVQLQTQEGFDLIEKEFVKESDYTPNVPFCKERKEFFSDHNDFSFDCLRTSPLATSDALYFAKKHHQDLTPPREHKQFHLLKETSPSLSRENEYIMTQIPVSPDIPFTLENDKNSVLQSYFPPLDFMLGVADITPSTEENGSELDDNDEWFERLLQLFCMRDGSFIQR